MAPRFDVVGLGENSVDHVYTLPEWPQPGGPAAKVRIAGYAVRPGGQVATMLAACAALGLRTAYIGAFGSDENGRRVRAELDRRGIDTTWARTRNAPNRHAVILIDRRHGERVVLWDRDPALALAPGELDAGLLRSTRVLHVDNVDEDVAVAAAGIARSAGADVSTDIDRAGGRTMDLVAAATIPVFAGHVPAALTGEPDLARALARLEQPHHRLLCATLGARGAALLAGGTFGVVAAPEVRAADTTGAGDVFRGALVYALLRGDSPADAVRFANGLAARSCTRPGALDSVPHRFSRIL